MTDITISDELSGPIEDRIRYTETVDDCAEFVLLEIVTHTEREDDGTRESTAADEEIQDRLQLLGYLEE